MTYYKWLLILDEFWQMLKEISSDLRVELLKNNSSLSLDGVALPPKDHIGMEETYWIYGCLKSNWRL